MCKFNTLNLLIMFTQVQLKKYRHALWEKYNYLTDEDISILAVRIKSLLDPIINISIQKKSDKGIFLPYNSNKNE